MKSKYRTAIKPANDCSTPGGVANRACSVALLLAIMAPLPVSAMNEALHVLDYSGRTHGLGAVDARSTIKTELALRIIKEGKSVLVVSEYDKTSNSCMSSVGVTTPTHRWHTPRIPNYTAATLVMADKTKPDYKSTCLESSIRQSIAKLGAYDQNKLIQETAVTQPLGGVRQVKPERKTINFISFGIKGEDLPVQDFNAVSFETAFDYRNVSVIFDASSWVHAGVVSCGVFAGITSTPPSGRNPFMPAHYEFSGIPGAKGTEQECKKAAAKMAAKKLLSKPFTEKGILLDFERTREMGIETPSSGSVSLALRRAGSSGGSSAARVRSIDPCAQKCTGPGCNVGPMTFAGTEAPAGPVSDACKKNP